MTTRRGTTIGRRAARAAALVALAGLAGLLTACSGSSTGGADQPNGAGSVPTLQPAADGAGWQVPDPLPAGRPGDVVAATPQAAVGRLAGSTRTALLYRSTDLRDRPVVVSGVLLVPGGEAPAGGWPVVSWGHGTTGVADRCAPSPTDNLFFNEYAQEVASFLDAGYAVVATDYPGLGTPGDHSYLVGDDEGRAMVDAVTAARALDPDLSARWFAVGHSQGGQAALFATRAAARAPGLDLRGTVAIAPASGLEAALPAILAGGAPEDLGSGVYMLVGLATVDPTVHLDDVLGPAGRQLRARITEDACAEDLAPRLADAEVSQIFDLTPEQAGDLSARIARFGDPENAPTVGPVLVVQGEADEAVFPALTEQMVSKLRDQGSTVELRTYPGLGHDEVLGPSSCDVLAWMADHGGPAASDCTPGPTDLS